MLLHTPMSMQNCGGEAPGRAHWEHRHSRAACIPPSESLHTAERPGPARLCHVARIQIQVRAECRKFNQSTFIQAACFS